MNTRRAATRGKRDLLRSFLFHSQSRVLITIRKSCRYVIGVVVGGGGGGGRERRRQWGKMKETKERRKEAKGGENAIEVCVKVRGGREGDITDECYQ